MNLSQIEYFLAVAEQLNFTNAAKSLYVSQPALSKQIALLEEELGTQLFLRNSRKVALTAAGISLEQDLKEIHKQLEQAKRRAMEIGKKEQRMIRIGCFDGIVIDDFLPMFYEHVRTVDEVMKISLYRGSFDEVRRTLEQDKIDILFTLEVSFTCGEMYHMRKLVRRSAVLVYSKKLLKNGMERLGIEELGVFPLLVLQQKISPKLYQNTLKNIKAVGIEQPIIFELENMATLRAYLEMGQGYTILTEGAVIGNPELFEIPLPDSMGTWVIGVWKEQNPIVEILMDNFGRE